MGYVLLGCASFFNAPAVNTRCAIFMHQLRLICIHAAAVIILGFFDSSKFYCSSRDVREETMPGEDTAYCIFVSEY